MGGDKGGDVTDETGDDDIDGNDVLVSSGDVIMTGISSGDFSMTRGNITSSSTYRRRKYNVLEHNICILNRTV